MVTRRSGPADAMKFSSKKSYSFGPPASQYAVGFPARLDEIREFTRQLQCGKQRTRKKRREMELGAAKVFSVPFDGGCK